MSNAAAPSAEALTDAHFHLVQEWVYRRTGIRFADTKRYFVDKRVASCVRKHGGTFETWFAALRLGTDPRLAQELINELTVNETYFLREDHQFDSMIKTVLPSLAQQRRATRNTAPIRILSLPCSTGEEPYSIGLRLLEEWPDIEHFDVEIVAGDIDSRVLDHARRAVYGPRSMSRVPPAVRSRWFERFDTEHYQVHRDLREAVDFRIVNITSPDSMRTVRGFDIAFCRNLLIYFDQISSQRAAEYLFDALNPGGYLFLGHSESMSRISPIFTPVRLAEGIAYQRPRSGATR